MISLNNKEESTDMAHSRSGSRDETDDVMRPSSAQSARGSLRSRGNSVGETNLTATWTNAQRPNALRAFREPSIRLRRSGGGGLLSITSTGATGLGSSGPSPLAESFTAADMQARANAEGGTSIMRTISSPYVGGPSVRTRGRSSSEPPQPNVPSVTDSRPGTGLAVLSEESSAPGGPLPSGSTAPNVNPRATALGGIKTPDTVSMTSGALEEGHLDSEMIDILDVVDPEVSTLTTLTNVQNSLFVPDLGRLLSRRPVYTITPSTTRVLPPGSPERPPTGPPEQVDNIAVRQELTRLSTITSTMDESRFAVLPHGATLTGWSAAEKEELNDHVRHMLHSRRSKIRRGFKGFLQYAKTPLGAFITIYATLITLFGLAWVLFLIGWINVGGRQLYVINIIDNVLVALFAIIGDGLAPFRAWDTYNMIYIAHFHHLSWKLRKQRNLSKLANKNDLPTQREEDIGIDDSDNVIVLSEKQQASLEKHERRFAKSHTFYKPHETTTHFAFPISYLIVIVTLLDCHSLLQIALGTCTWAISYHHRPFALTTVILCCSITANITAGILISVGDHKTRKKDVLERMFRQELTEEAIKKVEKNRIKREKVLGRDESTNSGLMSQLPEKDETSDSNGGKIENLDDKERENEKLEVVKEVDSKDATGEGVAKPS